MNDFKDFKDVGYGCLTSIMMVIGCIMIIFMMNSCCNNLTEETWNNGICAECDTRYDLRGVSNGLKYYSCPECGQEVRRY